MEIEFNLNKNKKITRWHVYIFCFVIVFVFTALQNIGLKGFSLISPQPKANAIESVSPKLEQIKNNFKLESQNNSFIETSFAASEYDNANAYAAVDLETRKVLVEKNLKVSFPIASLTKIMTAVVALDLADSNELFTVTETAAKQIPTKIGVVKGQRMSVSELLNALMLTSANDAAHVIKDGIDNKYGEEVFVEAMNKKAQFLGLENTNFSNPQGFDGRNNYSSAGDLAILAYYALKNYKEFRDIVKKDYEFLPADKNHKQFDLYNWNGLLGVYPGISGVKIGNTGRAGNTTLVVSKREGKEILAVMLGAPGVLERDLWTASILDKAFEEFNLTPVSLTEDDLRKKYATWKYWN
jgi:serine-type D-Ala-D-Ala carboxypeptidase (penicillin-binding protein 5/6)